MIDVRNVYFQYDANNGYVLQNLNLEIADGEFLCVIGPSGCGKSTLIHLLAGLNNSYQGSISIGSSHQLQEMNGPGTDRAIVFQHGSLFPWMTVWKNVVFATMKTRRFSRKDAELRAKAFLEKTDMLSHKDKYPYQLSGGMQQRAAIAKALAMNSETLLLDEPFSALDAKIRKELQLLLHNLWRENKKTVVFVTHDLEEAMILGTRIVFLKNGNITKDQQISGRINECCAKALKYEDCKALRQEMEAWFE